MEEGKIKRNGNTQFNCKTSMSLGKKEFHSQ